MNKISTLAAAIALVAVSTSSWSDNTLGEAPYFGAPVYAAPGLTEEQQKAFAEQQQQAFEQAVAAQREFAEQFSKDQMAAMDAQHKQLQAQFDNMAPAMPELPAHIAKRIQEREAQREAMIKEMEASRPSMPAFSAQPMDISQLLEEAQARRDERVKEMEARRGTAPARPAMSEEMSKRMEEVQARRDERVKEMEARRGTAPARPAMSEEMSKRMEEAQARRDERVKEMEVRRGEMLKKMEEHRKVAMQRVPFELPVMDSEI